MREAWRYLGSLDQAVRVIFGIVVLGAIGLLLGWLWSPEIDPLPPGDFDQLDQPTAVMETSEFEQVDDFVSRPLLLEGRRPLVATTVPAPKVVKEQSSVAAKVLENVTLLGVFSSGESRGVIILENGVDRRRMLVGEQTGDWTLWGVEPRAAVFKSGSAESRVEMGLIAIGQRSGGITVSEQTRQDSNLPPNEGDPEKAKAWKTANIP